MARNPSVCNSWARVYCANEQMARDEDEEVNGVQRWCEILHATILRTIELLVGFKECDIVRFLFLKCHFGCNVEKEQMGVILKEALAEIKVSDDNGLFWKYVKHI